MVQLSGKDVLTALPKFPSRQSNTILDHHPSLSMSSFFSTIPSHINSLFYLFIFYFIFKTNPLIYIFSTVRKRPLHRRIAQGICDGWNYVATHRVFRIPKLNWLIMSLLGAFLVKLVISFNRLYQRQALLTMLVSNLLLYGLADTLAQTLVSVLQFVPAKNDPHVIKFVLERQAADQLDLEQQQQQQQQFGAEDDYYEDGIDDTEDLVELGLVHDDDGFRDLDRHISGSTSMTMPETPKATSVMHLLTSPVNFDFRRLSLFMVWGKSTFFFFLLEHTSK
jgi:hypothetical protein